MDGEDGTGGIVIAQAEETGTGLVLPITIAELIGHRARIIQAWEDANEAIAGVKEAFAAIHDPDFHLIRESRGRHWEDRQDMLNIPEMIHALDYSLYVFALEKLNITKAMTETARDQFLAKLKDKKTPFTEKELIGLAQNADVLFRDSSLNTVREVYRKLIGVSYNGGNWGSGKKDNLQKVERVFRVGYSDLGHDTYRIGNNSWRYSGGFNGFRFNDLLTACRLIEGEGFTDYSNNVDSMCRNVPQGQYWVDTGYFTVTVYKVGNAKVKWNEDKIHVLEKLNAIGSGRENAMPDVRRKRYKAEHFHNDGMPCAEDFFKPDPKKDPSDDKDFAFFPTSETIALRMVELAEYDGELDTLEPSAGDGGIVKFIPWDFGCRAVEFNHHRALKLKAEFAPWIVYEADFLKWEAEYQFDRVLMNPPFNDRIEAVHLVKAWGHLKPGGILVAILPEGWFTRDDLKSRVLRAFLQANEYKPSESLPAGSFGKTRVVTRIVTLKKAIA